MIKLILLIKRKAELSPKQFREYYENQHVPLAMKHTGIFTQKYRRNYPLDEFGPLDTSSPEGLVSEGKGLFSYDCITEVYFNSQADFESMSNVLRDPVIGTAISEDESRFIDHKTMRVVLCEEVGE